MTLMQRILFGAGKKEATPIREYGWERVGMILRQDYLRLIGLNLLYFLCCLPIITIPAATYAMHRVILNWVRDRFEDMLPAFFREFRTDFFRRTVLGTLMLLSPFLISFYPFWFGSSAGTIVVLVMGLILYFCVSHYFYPLVVLLDVPILKNLKNACCMAALCWRDTVRMLLTAGLIDLTALIFTNQAVPLFVVFLFSFNCLLCCAFFNRPFEELFGNGEKVVQHA